VIGANSAAAAAVAIPAAADKDDAPVCCSSCRPSDQRAQAEELEAEGHGVKIPLLVACGILALLGTGLHLLAGEALALAASASSLVASLLGLYIVYPEVKEALLARRVDINILMVIAVIGATILGDFSEAGVVVFLFCMGEWLEQFAIDRNYRSISKLLELTPPVVEVLRQGAVVEAAPEQVQVGEVIIIKPGSRVPLDGEIVEGSSLIDESAITGESVPVEKGVGSPVYSGALNVQDFLRVRTTATVENSTLARVVELVRESQEKRSPSERAINRFARYYTPLVLLAAALVALVLPLVTVLGLANIGGFDVWVYRGLSMLVVACPCALVIATPVSIEIGRASCRERV
jgi:Cd2+/Zn2+-exporting ATPase